MLFLFVTPFLTVYLLSRTVLSRSTVTEENHDGHHHRKAGVRWIDGRDPKTNHSGYMMIDPRAIRTSSWYVRLMLTSRDHRDLFSRAVRVRIERGETPEWAAEAVAHSLIWVDGVIVSDLEDLTTIALRRGHSDEWLPTPTKAGRVDYQMLATGLDSQKLGPCEVCGEACADVFTQSEAISIQSGSFFAWQWTFARGGFGHHTCLTGLRITSTKHSKTDLYQ